MKNRTNKRDGKEKWCKKIMEKGEEEEEGEEEERKLAGGGW